MIVTVFRAEQQRFKLDIHDMHLPLRMYLL